MGIPEKRTLGMPMPLPQAKYVVIGLTNGPGFTPNPCLESQVDWVKQRNLMASAYAVHSFPDSTTLAQYGGKGPFDAGTDQGRLQNVGYQQSLYNLGNLKAAGLSTPDRVDRRRAGADLRVERRQGRERRGDRRSRPGLHRQRLPDRGLLHARALRGRGGRPEPRRDSGVARGRADLADRGAEPLR